ncbi:MAG: hypothetical protein GKR94_19775 [Gammaproteobacteria bacterium]|nr:hypothetical protein [Gammaproteobacteria bacterium]
MTAGWTSERAASGEGRGGPLAGARYEQRKPSLGGNGGVLGAKSRGLGQFQPVIFAHLGGRTWAQWTPLLARGTGLVYAHRWNWPWLKS